MTLQKQFADYIQDALHELYNYKVELDTNAIQKTKKEFEGDFTFVVFPLVKTIAKSPDQIAKAIGDKLLEKHADFFKDFNVIKGFLNVSLHDKIWLNHLLHSYGHTDIRASSLPIMYPILIEFSSPNTNKPLHLGHIRNNLLGNAVANILEAARHQVVRVNLVNDRGIHICKSMLAWLHFGNGETPENSGIKGDHLVGNYYVKFDQELKKEGSEWAATALQSAQEMLKKWEDNDAEVRKTWSQMNSWVYSGFEKTYQRLGIRFDKIYYESDTYLLGKQMVEEGVQNGAFYKKPDGSVWVNLADEGLDEKLLLRADGTSVYITQDLGTAQLRYNEFHPEKMIYVVGNEQNYHFDILKLILDKKLQKEYGKQIEHLSYGMVELPLGKMKSREGTVVDADDLMEEMVREAKTISENLGKLNFKEQEAQHLYEMLGMGALKYFILKVDPKKNMLFNPEESIDFNGNTAPFIQYTHARIKSLLKKAEQERQDTASEIPKMEKELIKLLYDFEAVLMHAAETLSPALIANYAFELAKEFNRFYQEVPILREPDTNLRNLRLLIAERCAAVIKYAMGLLGIEVPERM